MKPIVVKDMSSFMTPSKCKPAVWSVLQLPGVGKIVRSNSGNVPAWRWTSKLYGVVPEGGTYQETVTVIVQFLGTITQPPNMARPGSSLLRLVGGPMVSRGCQRAPSGSLMEGACAPGWN